MAEAKKQNNGNYSAENITWLEGLEAVRHRPWHVYRRHGPHRLVRLGARGSR
jgi:DNA gyrase/topoisomerase IV subunit B